MVQPTRVLLLGVVALLVVPPSPSRAQAMADVRVRAALVETDRRIAQAETVVAASADPQARAELDLARDLQARARSADAGGRPLLAGRFSLEARAHADRAVQIVQGLPDADRVVGQLERTRAMLERAGERLHGCDDGRARALLRVALEMQTRAENAEQAGRHLGALQQTMGARERGQRALRLCRMEEDAEEMARSALRQTDQVLARSREALEAGGSARPSPSMARDALARAIGLQDEATRQYRGGHYESSLQLTLAGRRLANRALRRGARGF